jgi:CubicO group peptidase (beta-lactamase class C family)
VLALACPCRSQGQSSQAPATSLTADPVINELLEPLREKHGMPALWGAIVAGDKVSAIGAVGVRKLGSPERATVNDKVHINNCTQAMTATLLAMLVEDGKLSWDTTLAEVFRDERRWLHKDFRGVTLAQLLTHTGGAPPSADWSLLAPEATATERRRMLMQMLFSGAPLAPPGTSTSFSDPGYLVAASIGETVADEGWQELMRRRLFEPLDMRSAGFGASGTKDAVDQPWGHAPLPDGTLESLQSNDAPLFDPLATVYCTLSDWAKFASLHLRGAQGQTDRLKPETFAVLHTPPMGLNYACGWFVGERSWAQGRTLSHAAKTRSYNFAVIWMAPNRDFAVLVAANCGGDAAAKACDEAAFALIQHHLALP